MDVAKICVKAELVLNIELIMLDANAAGVSGASRRARPRTFVRGLEVRSLSDVLMEVQARRMYTPKWHFLERAAARHKRTIFA